MNQEISKIEWHHMVNRKLDVPKAIQFARGLQSIHKYLDLPSLTSQLYSDDGRETQIFAEESEYEFFISQYRKKFEDINFLVNYSKSLLVVCDKLIQVGTKRASEAENGNASSLVDGIEGFEKLWAEYHAHAWLMFFFSEEIEQSLVESLSEYFGDDFNSMILIITGPSQISPAQEMEFGIVELAKQIQDGKNIDKFSSQIANEFGWVSVYNFADLPLTSKYFIERASELVTKGTRASESKTQVMEAIEINNKKFGQIVNRIADPVAAAKVIFLHNAGHLRDYRAMVREKAALIEQSIFKKFSLLTNVSLLDLTYLTTAEMRDLLNGDEATKEKLRSKSRERQLSYVLSCDEKGLEITEGRSSLPTGILSSKNDTTKELKGMVAFASGELVRGRVRVVLNSSELVNVKEGNILVTSMTKPNYIQAMQKAAAIVTDEGGITCHAAIVARELKKPCIIGTKNATKIFHDGDIVEVDTSTGAVRIIEKK